MQNVCATGTLNLNAQTLIAHNFTKVSILLHSRGICKGKCCSEETFLRCLLFSYFHCGERSDCELLGDNTVQSRMWIPTDMLCPLSAMPDLCTCMSIS